MDPKSLIDCVNELVENQLISEMTKRILSKYIEDHKYYLCLQYHRDFTWSEVYTNFTEYFVLPISIAMDKTKVLKKLDSEVSWIDMFITIIEFRDGMYKKISKDIFPITATHICNYIIWLNKKNPYSKNPLDKVKDLWYRSKVDRRLFN